MDEENSDEEDEGQRVRDQQQQAAKKMPKDLPMPPNPENVIIRRDYDPKNKAATSSQQKPQGDTYFKSPLTGELIPAASMSEHMRISMLDPRWIEQRQKEKQERETHEEVLASGMSIEKNLKRMAEYRSDMFGSGVEEALIGRKLGSHEAEEKSKNEESHANSSMDKTTSKRALTVEDQLKAIHQSQGLVEDDSAKIGPSIPKGAPGMPPKPAAQTVPQQTIMLSNYKILNVPAGTLPTQVAPPLSQSRPMVPQFGGMPPMPMSLGGEQQAGSDEPSAKRVKTAEEQLVPEAEFLALHGAKGPVKFIVQVPSVSEKPEWNLNGQSIPFSMDLTDTVISFESCLS